MKEWRKQYELLEKWEWAERCKKLGAELHYLTYSWELIYIPDLTCEQLNLEARSAKCVCLTCSCSV